MKSKSVKISSALRERYETERLKLEKSGTQDPDSPMLPIENREHAIIGKFYRPLKTAVSVRIDNDVLAWIKAQGEGHLTRTNEILRHAMLTANKRQ